jgi:hypothetical protein
VLLGFDLLLDNDDRSLDSETVATVATIAAVASGKTKTVTTVDGARKSEAESVTEIVAIRDLLGGYDNLFLNNDWSLMSETVAAVATETKTVTISAIGDLGGNNDFLLDDGSLGTETVATETETEVVIVTVGSAHRVVNLGGDDDFLDGCVTVGSAVAVAILFLFGDGGG